MNGNDIYLQAGSDRNHGLGYRSAIQGRGVDGPFVYGYNGGALGVSSPETISLRWDYTGNVWVSNNITCVTLNQTSDRNLKENLVPVNPQEVLNKVVALPLNRWNFTHEKSTSHLGPMAQDFHAAFGLGTDDKHIATVDADGVAFAAIPGLNEKLTGEVTALRSETTALKQRLDRLEKILGQSVEK